MSVIVTRALTMQFGAQRALDSLDLDVPEGVTGLVGANGILKGTRGNIRDEQAVICTRTIQSFDGN